MWEFFYGPDLGDDDIQPTIGARTYDIDVVEGVVEVMRAGSVARHEKALEEWQFQQDQGVPATKPVPPTDDPVITIMPPTRPGTTGVFGDPREIELDQLRGTSASERTRLWVTGGGVTVSFIEGRRVWTSGDETVRKSVETYLRSEGRRRFPHARLAAASPTIAALVLVVLWILILATGEVGVLEAAFGSILTAGAVVGGVISTRLLLRRIWQRQADSSRFREGSRAEFRAAVLSVKAGVLTTILGGVLGVFVTVAIQKFFGLDPS